MPIPPRLVITASTVLWHCSHRHEHSLYGACRFHCDTPHRGTSPLPWALPAFHVPITLSAPRKTGRLILLGASYGPDTQPRRAACNGTGIFIASTFTHPRVSCHAFPHGDRPVHSEVRQRPPDFASHILAMSIRHPAYPYPAWKATPAGTFCRLYRAFDRPALVCGTANRRISVDALARYRLIPSIGLSVL